MATSKFDREPKMMTTEPSADKLKSDGMKKGGHAKRMASGGANKAMLSALLQRKMPTRRPAPMMARTPMQESMQPSMQAPMKRGGKAHYASGGAMSDYDAKMMDKSVKKARGGEMESPKEHKSEMQEMRKMEKELKHHESMKASKAHHGLKNGGKAMYEPPIGGLLSEGKPHGKGKTGDIEGAGYKRGGKADGGGTMQMMPRGGAYLKGGGKMAKGGQALAAKGDAFQTKGTLKPKINVQDKVSEAKQTKSFNTKTSGVEGAGYKNGGKMKKFATGGTVSQNVAGKYLNNMKDGSKKHTKGGKTGEIKQKPAGYKNGGHVAMTCKSEGGFTLMKKMAKC